MGEKQVRPGQLRVTHAERQATVERLGAAMTAGCLTLAEFEDRVDAAWAAGVHSQLDPLTADLPSGLAIPASGNRTAAGRMLPVLRSASVSWLVICAIGVILWGMACMAGGTLATPWFVLAIGGGGAVLAPLWHLADIRAPGE
jgi:Domain of unknown function (DUF1707)